MDEGLSGNSIDTGSPAVDESITEFEPLDDLTATEVDTTSQELAELFGEAGALGIEPLDESPYLEPLDGVEIDPEVVFEGLNSYDFDGIDINQNREMLDGLLDGFQEDNWSNLDLAGQKEQISGLFDYVNESLGLENPPIIEYYQGDVGEYGGFDPTTNTLSINENMLYESDEAADTVAHELWHAYQHERASNPQSPKDFMYQFGFDNYIRPSDDFDGYQSQLVEAEARAFADQFKGALARKGV